MFPVAVILDIILTLLRSRLLRCICFFVAGAFMFAWWQARPDVQDSADNPFNTQHEQFVPRNRPTASAYGSLFPSFAFRSVASNGSHR